MSRATARRAAPSSRLILEPSQPVSPDFHRRLLSLVFTRLIFLAGGECPKWGELLIDATTERNTCTFRAPLRQSNHPPTTRSLHGIVSSGLTTPTQTLCSRNFIFPKALVKISLLLRALSTDRTMTCPSSERSRNMPIRRRTAKCNH